MKGMQHVKVLLASGMVALLLMNCEPEEFKISSDPTAMVRFSRDTVLFDTVFSGVETITQRFQVYNDISDALVISDISLAGGSQSQYSVTVNGRDVSSIGDVRLLANDSMLVLVSANIDPANQDLPFIVRDSVIFTTNGNLQDVKLLAWGQDANYVNDSILACNTTWTKGKPYVVFNSMLVDSLCTLTIEPGTRVFSHFGSTIFIQGTLQAEGMPDDRITFLNDRQDGPFLNAPGQWGGIFFLEGSKGNSISYADIRNAEYGIWLGTPDTDTIPDLHLSGVKIENMSRSGVVAFTSDMKMDNTLINNCVEFAFGGLAGGSYELNHCTLANSSTQFFREGPTIAASDNLVLGDGSVLTAPIHLTLANSIIWGDQSDEVFLSNEGGEEFQSWINYNILKTTIQGLDSSHNLVNVDPQFLNPLEYDFKLDSLSPAIDIGIPSAITSDLDGIPRDSLPDLGAYEFVELNEM